MVADDAMSGQRAQRIRLLEAAILKAQGDLDPDLRRAAFDRAGAWARGTASEESEVPEPLAGFVDKVARHAYKVWEEDIERLQQAGYSEDAIFEAVVATAVGAGLSRLDVGLRALGKGR